jgi:hypothetical protein
MPSHFYFDIETIPGPTQPDPVYPKTPELDDFSPPSNWKDEAKRKAYSEDKLAAALAGYEAARKAAEMAAEAAWRTESLKSHRGRVLVIGWAIDGEPVQSVQHDGSDEEGLIVDFWKRLRSDLGQTQRPSIIGFNCRDFDCNWLRHRAYKYHLPAMASFFPFERYDKRVIDLREQWLGADYRGEGTLDDLAKFLGLSGKTAGIDGSKVFDFWQAGRVDEVAAYCRQDVELTRELWARMHEDEARFLLNERAA